MNLVPVYKFGTLNTNKDYFVYDAHEGFAVARPYINSGDIDWTICLNSEQYNLFHVTHVAELPPNPHA